MIRAGFIGWRGMVGSVLMDRMISENGFNGIEPVFMSTSQVGQPGPDIGIDHPELKDAFDMDILKDMDIIVTCQGSAYTDRVYPALRKAGWDGYWIDAASALRMQNSSVIVLDPVNREVIDNALAEGKKEFVGGNCTVSLMLMAIAPLLQQGNVEWLTSMTYQSASGAGAKNMRELIEQMAGIAGASQDLLANPASTALEIDKRVINTMRKDNFPVKNFGFPLAGSVLPWIDTEIENGQSREEWKGQAETNKILNNADPIPIDGLCVRVGSMRCHSQALTIKLNKDIPIDEIHGMLRGSNKWVEVIPNTKEETLKHLTPAAITGSLRIPVGRIRKLTISNKHLTLFTVGDQLLWGAAEPVRRMFQIALEHIQG